MERAKLAFRFLLSCHHVDMASFQSGLNAAPRPRTTSSSSSVKTAKPLSQLRSLYRSATGAFLLRDYSATAAFLHDAHNLNADSRQDPSEWFTALEQSRESPELELRRKLTILEITFLATVLSHPGTVSPSSVPTPFSHLLSLPPSTLVRHLWAQAINDATTPPPDIFPSSLAAFVHPSIIISLALASLKLDEPRLARAVLEAWFGSVSEQVDRMIGEESDKLDLSREFLLDGTSLSVSNLAAGKEKVEPRKALVGSWLKLLDLLVLHVLPRLGEWEAAGDFVRLQGVENGGWVPDARIEVSFVCAREGC